MSSNKEFIVINGQKHEKRLLAAHLLTQHGCENAFNTFRKCCKKNLKILHRSVLQSLNNGFKIGPQWKLTIARQHHSVFQKYICYDWRRLSQSQRKPSLMTPWTVFTAHPPCFSSSRLLFVHHSASLRCPVRVIPHRKVICTRPAGTARLAAS